MNIHIELAKHEIKRIDDTVLVHNLDNNTVVQLNGTGSVMFLQLTKLQNNRGLSMNAVVTAIIDQYPEMRGKDYAVEEDIKNFIKDLSKTGLLKNGFVD